MPIPATQYIWFNGKLVPWEKATVHVLSHALHYGSSVFEGVRAYETPRGVAIFRLQRSHAAPVRFGEDLSHQHAVHARTRSTRLPRSHRAVNGLTRGAYLRPVAFRGYGEIGVAPKIDPPVEVAIAAWEWGKYSARERRRRRRRVRLVVAARGAEHHSRAWPRPAATICRASSSASRRSASASPKASASRRTARVSEGAGENLFLVKDGVLLHAGPRALGARRHHARHRDDAREGARHRSARDRRCRARCSTSPTSCSSPARRRRSRRSARWIACQSATASAARSREALQAAFFGLFPARRRTSGAGSTTWTCRRRAPRWRRRADMPKTLFEKVWDAARGRARDRRYAGRPVHRPAPHPRGDHAAGVHRAARARPASAPPGPHARDDGSLDAHAHRAGVRRRADHRSSPRRSRSAQLESNCAEFGVELLGLQDSARAASCTSSVRSSALTQPGKTIVCGDSHTSTHGAFGALAFGIGTTEVGHVLATQCLLQRKPKTFAINVRERAAARRHGEGPDPRASSARSASSGGTGHVIEYRGDGHSRARHGRAHDHLQHVDRSRRARRHDRAGRDDLRLSRRTAPRAPQGRGLGCAPSRAGASCRPIRARASTSEVDIDAATLEPMITYGTHPGMVVPVTGYVPARSGDAGVRASRSPTWASRPATPIGDGR